MVGILLEGKVAVTEHKRLLKEGKEVSVAVRERDDHGRKRSLWLQFGMNSSTAWVYCLDEPEGMEPQTILEAVLAHEAGELFGSYLERMELRRCLVDPSPLSPAFVEVQPCIGHVIDDLGAEFGIRLEVWVG